MSLLLRRRGLIGFGAGLLALPALARAGALMPVRSLPPPERGGLLRLYRADGSLLAEMFSRGLPGTRPLDPPRPVGLSTWLLQAPQVRFRHELPFGHRAHGMIARAEVVARCPGDPLDGLTIVRIEAPRHLWGDDRVDPCVGRRFDFTLTLD